ncbi:nicotinate (nicotinamide) nucleotide adenylyltransferase [Parabacteroides sp. APC149_11_2_Y6]
MEKAVTKITHKLKTGIYSGSFNPIHIGHLALANWLCEFGGMDEIWFLVTPHNPLKKRDELMDDNLRYQMVKAAVGDYSKFKASDFEFNLPKPTYTITTLRSLQQAYPDRDFHLIIGADNWASIEQWKDYQALLSEFPILIYPRKGFDIRILEHYSHIRQVDAPLIEISSTFIRQALNTGKDVRFFIPEAIRKTLLAE